MTGERCRRSNANTGKGQHELCGLAAVRRRARRRPPNGTCWLMAQLAHGPSTCSTALVWGPGSHSCVLGCLHRSLMRKEIGVSTWGRRAGAISPPHLGFTTGDSSSVQAATALGRNFRANKGQLVPSSGSTLACCCCPWPGSACHSSRSASSRAADAKPPGVHSPAAA